MFELSQEQRMLVDAVGKLAEKEFSAHAFEWEGDTPWENVEVLAKEGFLGINFDEAYGGGGMTEFESMLVIETVGRVCPDTASFLVNQQLVAPRAIEMFGSDAAKEEYLPPVISGEDYIAIAISEPEAGSDVRSMKTQVTEKDGVYRLDGEKTWVSNADEASAAVVWARFPDELGTVIVDFDEPGVEMAEHYTNMAGETQSQFYLEGVPILEDDILTRGQDGFKKQLKSLNWERLGSATLANTLALCGLERALEYAQQREQFGQSIADFQGIEWKLAEMAKEVQLSRTYAHQAANVAVKAGRVPDPLQTSIAKLQSATIAEEVVSEALQIHGANGYQQGHPLEYLYRFARGRRLAGGTTEIQKNLIASEIKRNGIASLY